MDIATINYTEGENVMTDFQFRAIMAMVLDMLEKVDTLDKLEETKSTIGKLTKGITDIKDTPKNKE